MRPLQFKSNGSNRRSSRLVDGKVFSSKKIFVVRTRRAEIFRGITAMLVVISWFAISNHCALGLAAVANHQTETVSQHACCASDLPVPPKPAKDSGAPCCKTLLATSAAPAKFCDGRVVLLVGAVLDRTLASLTLPPHATAAFQFLDTGPPGRTFAESVLQQSLLAHAPPPLA